MPPWEVETRLQPLPEIVPQQGQPRKEHLLRQRKSLLQLLGSSLPEVMWLTSVLLQECWAMQV